MSRKSVHIVVLAVLVALLAAQPAPAGYNILANGSFETGTDPGMIGEIFLPAGSPAIPSWVIGAPVYYVGGFWPASQGVRSVNLYTGAISQNFTPTPGAMYQVSFDVAGDPTLGPATKYGQILTTGPNSAFFQFKDFSFYTGGASLTNMGWYTLQFNFWGNLISGPNNSNLAFYSTTSPGGPALDNVVLAPVSSILWNGSFESGDSSLGSIVLPSGSTAINYWLVGGNGIEIYNAFNGWLPSQNTFSLNLNSSTGPGSIQQTLTTAPGELYQVSFDMAGDPTGGNPIKSLRVSAAGQSMDFAFDTTGKSTNNMGWVTKTWSFTANAATAVLVFQSLDSGSYGPALDNVRVIHPANLVLNGSFEDALVNPGTSFVTLGYGSPFINGWTVAGNGLDYIGATWQASQGSRSLDLNAVAAGSIEQTFLTTSGVTYDVAFDLAGNPGISSPPAVKTLRVSAGGRSQDFSFDTTGKTLANMGWTTKHFIFTAIWKTTTLLFESLTPGDAGPALDNVVVTNASATVPYLLLLD